MKMLGWGGALRLVCLFCLLAVAFPTPCEVSDCSGNGNCNEETGTCVCNTGFAGVGCEQCAEPCSPGYYRPSCTGSCVRCTTDPCTVAGTYRPNECAAGLTYRDPPCTLCPTLPNRTSWVEGGQNCDFTCETGWQRNGSTNWAVDACITCYECVQENSIYHYPRGECIPCGRGNFRMLAGEGPFGPTTCQDSDSIFSYEYTWSNEGRITWSTVAWNTSFPSLPLPPNPLTDTIRFTAGCQAACAPGFKWLAAGDWLAACTGVFPVSQCEASATPTLTVAVTAEEAINKDGDGFLAGQDLGVRPPVTYRFGGCWPCSAGESCQDVPVGEN